MSGNIDVLKQALEALEPLSVDAELRGDNFPEGNRIHKMADAGFKAIAAIKEALAALVQRCALCNYQHGHAIGCKNNPVDIALAKLAQPASAQELRGYQWLDTAIFRKKLPDNAEASAWHPLYTTPTERKPLFAEMIAEHEGLAEELNAINMGTPVDKLYFPPEESDGTFVDEGTKMDVEPDGHFLDFAYADSIAQVYVYDQFTKGQPFYSSPPTEKRQWVEVVQVKWEGGKLIAKLKENTT